MIAQSVACIRLTKGSGWSSLKIQCDSGLGVYGVGVILSSFDRIGFRV